MHSWATKTANPFLPKQTPGGFKEVLFLAYPVVLTQLSETIMGVVDSAMVGRLGATELAAVGFASAWLWTLFSLVVGTASGVQTFVAQSDGARQSKLCGAWAWYALYVVVPVGLLLVAALVFFAEPALRWLGPSPHLQTLAAQYIHTRAFGELGYAVMMIFMCFFRGLENMRTPLYAFVFVVIANAVLDYLLIFGAFGFPEWGVAGAGIAFSISTWSGVIALFVAFSRRSVSWRYNTRLVAPDLTQIRRFLRTSAPIGGQWCIGMASFAVFFTFVARMGDDAMAASQACMMLLSLSFMQALGISIASSTLVGRYVGANDPESAERTHHNALKLGVALAMVIAMLFLLLPIPLLRIFTDSPEIVRLGRPLLLLGAFFQLMEATAIIAEGSLRGAGDTHWAFGLETVLGWGLLVPASYLLGVVLEGGLIGAWYSSLIHISAVAVGLLWRFHSRAWRQIRI